MHVPPSMPASIPATAVGEPVPIPPEEWAAYKVLRRRHWWSAVMTGLSYLLATLPSFVVEGLKMATGTGALVKPVAEAIGLGLTGLVALGIAVSVMLYLLGTGVKGIVGLLILSLPATALLLNYLRWSERGDALHTFAAAGGLIFSAASIVWVLRTNHLRRQIQVYRDRWGMDRNVTQAPPPPEEPMGEHDIPADWDNAKASAAAPPPSPTTNAPREDHRETW